MTLYSLEESIHISEETIASIFKVDLSYIDTMQPGDTTYEHLGEPAAAIFTEGTVHPTSAFCTRLHAVTFQKTVNLYILCRDNLKSYLQFVVYNIDCIDNKLGKDVLPEFDATSNRMAAETGRT